jgi:pimeloyl-ACP methyl ester carboxylesterase
MPRLVKNSSSIPALWSMRVNPFLRLLLKSAIVGTLALAIVAFVPAYFSQSTSIKNSSPQKPVFQPCTFKDIPEPVSCGSISVYENRAAHTGRKINIRFVVLGSTSRQHAPDPIFDIAGGPGIASAEGAPEVAQIFGYVRLARDIVLVDQRGTGQSNPLTCDMYEGEKMPQAVFEGFLPVGGVRHCRQKLEKDADLTQYTTDNAMDDLDDVRAALGYDKINLHALSYGTIASQTYIQRHGEHVRLAMMEGAAPLNFKIPLYYARDSQHALEGLLADCAADAPCAKAHPDPNKALQQAIALLSRGPVNVDIEYQEHPSTVQYTLPVFMETLRNLLYRADLANQIPILLAESAKGNFVPMAMQTLEQRSGDAVYPWGQYLTITCAEHVHWITEAEIKAQSSGSPFADYRIRRQQEGCQYWPTPAKVTPPDASKFLSNVPTLIITGTLDPVTPPVRGREVQKALPNSKVVEIPHGGHLLVGLKGIECLDDMEGEFLLSANLKKLNTACAAKITREPF